MRLANLVERQLCHPPKWLPTNTMYLTIMGSEAYGVKDTNDPENNSDTDYYGFCVPPKTLVFRHLQGVIEGFGDQGQTFEQWQEHHVHDPDARKGRGQTYDFSIFNIVKYFKLCADGNPNMVDSLFTSIEKVVHSTPVGELVRQHRHKFLSKKVWHTFRGYANAQLHKMTIKEPQGKRKEMVEQHGMDLKFAYHIVRLMREVEQIMAEGELDLMRNKEELKAIRRGEWTEAQIRGFFQKQQVILDDLYGRCKLPEKPDMDFLKQLLLNALEMHYGSLDKCIVDPDNATKTLMRIREIMDMAGY